MADRSTYSGSSSPMPTGIEFLDQYADRMSQLFNNSVLPLHSVGGTGDAVTASVDPPLTAGLVAGMKFGVTWAAANTGAMTLAIAGLTALPVLDADGAETAPFAAAAGRRALLEYVGGAFVVLGGSGGGGVPPYFEMITTSTAWVKPEGFADSARAEIILIGGGGGGYSHIRQGANNGNGSEFKGNSGGRGNSAMWVGTLADLPSTAAVSIGAGGTGATAAGTTVGHGGLGGATSFGNVISTDSSSRSFLEGRNRWQVSALSAAELRDNMSRSLYAEYGSDGADGNTAKIPPRAPQAGNAAARTAWDGDNATGIGARGGDGYAYVGNGVGTGIVARGSGGDGSHGAAFIWIE